MSGENRFGKREMDCSLSQGITRELMFERREERPRSGKQRILFLKAGEVEHGFSVELVSGPTVPDDFQCLRNGLLIAARTCFSFGRTASGWAAMYSSTDLGTLRRYCMFQRMVFHTHISTALDLLLPVPEREDCYHCPKIESFTYVPGRAGAGLPACRCCRKARSGV